MGVHFSVFSFSVAYISVLTHLDHSLLSVCPDPTAFTAPDTPEDDGLYYYSFLKSDLVVLPLFLRLGLYVLGVLISSPHCH